MIKVKEDLTGAMFGKLKVLQQVEDYISPKGYKLAQWLCECSCPEHNCIIVTGNSLKTGNTTSCGCNALELRRAQKKENKKELFDNYGVIWSSNTNEKIYFDIEDADKILQHAWRKDSLGYPATTISNQKVFMHTFLGYNYPDHHNRNKLDNRRENLMPCTVQENNRNKTIGKNNKSGIIGVCWHKNHCKWQAYIKIDSTTRHLGEFDNKEDAIRARLSAELKIFGEFAPQKHLFKQYKINGGGNS